MGHEAGPLTNGHDKAGHLPACAAHDRGKLSCTRSCGRGHTSHMLVRTRARDDATEWLGACKIGAGEHADTCGVAFIRPPKENARAIHAGVSVAPLPRPNERFLVRFCFRGRLPRGSLLV